MHFTLQDEYITLSQLLKVCDIVSSGGEAKAFLQENSVLLNGVEENRRGKKIYSKDVVEVDGIRIEVE